MRTVFTTAQKRPLPMAVAPPPAPSAIPPWLLPEWLTDALLGRGSIPAGGVEEIRLRAGREASLTVGGENIMTPVMLTGEELTTILIHMCGGSLYAFDQTIREGYVTLPGGIRVGVAGRAVCEEGRIIGVYDVTGLCIRLPHAHGRMGAEICRLLRSMAAEGGAPRGVLIYAPPGEGKTTLLRAVAAAMAGADGRPPWRTVVVDTRGELCFDTDGERLCMDVLRGYPRARGVEIATRTLSAQLIVCDEIGDLDEAMALISTHHGGVPILASAHGATVGELLRRTGIRLLHESRLFSAYVGIRRDGRGDFTYRVTSHRDAEGAAEREDAEERGLCAPALMGGGHDL